MNGSSKSIEEGEAFLYQPHLTEHALLKLGYPYDAIQTYSDNEVQLKLAIAEIMSEKEKSDLDKIK